MKLQTLLNICVYGLMFTTLALCVWSCGKEPETEICVKGTVIGQGCLTGSYAILLQGKNKDYGIAENVNYDNVVETLNLPDEYKVNGTQLYFTFTNPKEEVGKYLTYCASAPQVVLQSVSKAACPLASRRQTARKAH